MNYTYDFARWHRRTFGTEITREQHRIIASLKAIAYWFAVIYKSYKNLINHI